MIFSLSMRYIQGKMHFDNLQDNCAVKPLSCASHSKLDSCKGPMLSVALGNFVQSTVTLDTIGFRRSERACMEMSSRQS